MASHRKGQTIHSEARTMIKRVAEKCDEEAVKGELLHSIHMPNARTAEYTGLSKRTIMRIRNESSSSGEETLRSPGKKRPRNMDTVFYCSQEDRTIIRNIINDFYITKKIVPTGPKILAAIREEIDFPWSIHTLRRLLHNMGYKWKKSCNVRKVLIERPNIVAWRSYFLTTLFRYRSEKRNIVYIDETWVDNTLTFGKCWQSEEQIGIVQSNAPSHRLVIVHAGGANGFVPNAALIFKSRSATGDYHGTMNSVNFEKWVSEKLLPNVPEKTVVIMDNAPYHSVQLNKPPSKYAKKSDMCLWLSKNNIPYEEGMRKYSLAELVARHKPTGKTYKIDEIIKTNGHSVLRLPPYMCDLNPIELAWAQVKRTIREKNVSTLTSERLQSLASEAIASVTATDWANFCKHTENIEKKYWDTDNILESATDQLTADLEDTDTAEEEDGNISSEDV